jgi:hypothetical protein
MGLLAAFVAGAVIDGWLRTNGPPKPAQVRNRYVLAAPSSARPAPRAEGAAASPAPPAPVATSGDISAGGRPQPITARTSNRSRAGSPRREGGSRPHEAVDMRRRATLRCTPWRTAIAKLFTSKAGGSRSISSIRRHLATTTRTSAVCRCLKDGKAVSKGDVVGYVGTAGNTPPHTAHLHFAVFELNADKRWWQGRPIDPYLVFRDRS